MKKAKQAPIETSRSVEVINAEQQALCRLLEEKRAAFEEYEADCLARINYLSQELMAATMRDLKKGE